MLDLASAEWREWASGSVRGMGLLTDPNTGGGGASKLVTLVTSHHTKLSWLLYIAGVAFLLGQYLTITRVCYLFYVFSACASDL